MRVSGYVCAMRWSKHVIPLLAFAMVCPALGALITHHEDESLYAPVVDGVLSTNEYGPGNAHAYTGGGGGGFGDTIVYTKASATRLYIAFDELPVPANEDQYLIYLNTRPGGLQPDGADMDDTADAGRSNVTRLSRDGTETVTYHDGVTTADPDFTLAFNNRASGSGGFSALFELAPTGQSHGLVTHQAAGLGTTTVEFSVPLDALDMAPGEVVDFAGFFISETGFLSNKGIPDTGLGANPGFADGQTNVFADFHRFTTLNVGPQFSLNERVPNVTLNMPMELPPEADHDYVIEDALDSLPISQPMSIRTPPGETNRLFVSRRPGEIIVVTNMAAPTSTSFLDIIDPVTTGGEGGLISFAFHPDYASNGYYYVYYALHTTTALGSGFHLRLSRFQVSSTNANWSDPNSELVLFTQFHNAANHNGGDLLFGSDGYLYLSLGDEGGANDTYDNGQRIDGGFFASVIRIDVDMQPGSLAPTPHPAIDGAATNYAIPPDNPFIGATEFNAEPVDPDEVRTEIYAIGLRNPFRMSFDPITGDLYVADVGQGSREEVDLIVSGGNYGWKWREGTIANPSSSIGSPPPGFTNWIDPILDYTRGNATNQGTTITGGVVYRGDALPELVGHYIFGDYGSGHIWALTHDGVQATSFDWLATTPNIVSFGTDPRNGDVLMASLSGNRIRRLVRSTDNEGSLPQTLSETGTFYDHENLVPYAGIVPYDLNVPFWSDNAIKQRWFSVPDTNLTMQFAPEGNWTFPDGAVWIKHFDLELVRGEPSSTRRLETRLLVKNSSGAGGYGVTYRWGASTDDAVLVPAEGLSEAFVIEAGGVLYTQVWRYPSRAECLQCHQPGAGFALGFNTTQLNRDFDYDGLNTNQLCALGNVGYLQTNVRDIVHTLPALAHRTNDAYSVEYRARSYLQANCAQCHFPGGSALGSWDARIQSPLSQTDIVNGDLVDDQGDTNNLVIVPGSVPESMIHTRIVSETGDRMPPVASTLVDTGNVALVVAWINELTGYQTFEEWQIVHFGSAAHPDAQPGEDPDEDGADNNTEFLTDTDPDDDQDVWTMDLVMQDGTPAVFFPRTANRGFEIQANTNLLTASGWRPLNVPANRPLFGSATEQVAIEDPTATNLMNRYYRIRIYEP